MANHRNKTRREKDLKRAMGKYKSKNSASAKHRKRSVSRHPTYETMKSQESLTYRKIEGVFSYSGRGFGFCVPDPEYHMEDVFIPPRKTLGAMTGDRVVVELYPRSGHAHGSSVEGEVLSAEYKADSIIGTLRLGEGYAYVIPDAKRFGVIVYVPLKEAQVIGAKDLDKVEVIPSGEPYFTRTRSITVPGPRDMPYFDTMGHIATLFGSSLSKEANYSAILHSAGIRTTFPENVLRHADEVSRQPLTVEGRVDLRGEQILTIDGADAKDLDDAISLKHTEKGWTLGVHIADVSHYVRGGTPTEEEAVLRGTSVYFTDKVVPMLPESLSNGACSLNAGTDKYALSAEIDLDPRGRRLGTRIYKSILNSTVRGVYSEVNDLFEKGENSPYREKYAAVAPMLADMRELYEILRAQSEKRGVMELEDSEALILLDESGMPAEIVKRERGDGEKLIEQFMLQANMGVAEVLSRLGLPCLYRIHERPDEEKLKHFATFAHTLGLDVRGLNDKEMDAASLSRCLMGILNEAREKGLGSVVSSVLLRSMMKAKYSAVCEAHFGLCAEKYCHFTSPIRRYPDLFVHTVITTVLEKTGQTTLSADSAFVNDHVPALSRIAGDRGVSSTDCEIRALEAERNIEDLYMALYMSERIGQVFDVTVSSVIRSGLFVQCDNLVEGFVSVLSFPGAKINEERLTLSWGKTLLTLGSPLRVRVADVDLSAGKITFEPCLSSKKATDETERK